MADCTHCDIKHDYNLAAYSACSYPTDEFCFVKSGKLEHFVKNNSSEAKYRIGHWMTDFSHVDYESMDQFLRQTAESLIQYCSTFPSVPCFPAMYVDPGMLFLANSLFKNTSSKINIDQLPDLHPCIRHLATKKQLIECIAVVYYITVK